MASETPHFDLPPPTHINQALISFYNTEQPSVLVLRGDGDERHLEVVLKTDLSLWEKIKAFFGHGDVALNHVSGFIASHIEQIDLSDETVRNALILLNTKIGHRNDHSIFLHTQRPLTICSPIALTEDQLGGGISQTWKISEKEATDNTENALNPLSVYANEPIPIDFLISNPNQGLMIVGDFRGHHEYRKVKQENYSKLVPFFGNYLHEHYNRTHLALSSLAGIWRPILREASHKFCELGAQSTVVVAQILQGDDGKRYLFYAASGDSDLYLIKADGTYKRLTDPNIQGRNPSFYGEKSHTNPGLGGHIQNTLYDEEEIQPGDKIIAVTDGITDFMSDEYLVSVVQEVDTTPANLMGKLIQRIKTGNQAELQGKKGLDPYDLHNSDDVGVGMMIVPD